MAAAGMVGSAGAIFYQRSQKNQLEEELADEKLKNRQKLRATAEYTNRKARYLERKKKKDALYRRIGVYNENDEMAIQYVKKVDKLPEGAIELDEVGVSESNSKKFTYKPTSAMSVEQNIKNLENLNQ